MGGSGTRWARERPAVPAAPSRGEILQRGARRGIPPRGAMGHGDGFRGTRGGPISLRAPPPARARLGQRGRAVGRRAEAATIAEEVESVLAEFADHHAITLE